MSSRYGDNALLPSLPLTVPFDSWEKFVLDDCATKHGVKWVYRRCYPTDQYSLRHEPALSRSVRRFRQRQPVNKWTITYCCNHAGKPRTVANQRPAYKKPTPTDCKASLVVEYKYSDPDNVLLTVLGAHNHALGGNDTAYARKRPHSEAFLDQADAHESASQMVDVRENSQQSPSNRIVGLLDEAVEEAHRLSSEGGMDEAHQMTVRSRLRELEKFVELPAECELPVESLAPDDILQNTYLWF